MLRFSLSSLLLLSVALTAGPPKADDPSPAGVEVQVLAILASAHHVDVHAKLAGFAAQVKKKDPTLTGFRLERATVDSLLPGEMKAFPLVGKEVVEVTVNRERNEKGRIMLTIKPPKLDQITYECACNKFFSVATQHYVGQGKDRQQLFIAVMATPCSSNK